MRIIRALGILTGIVSVASWLDARSARRRAQRREGEAVDRARWESEGGATRSGPHVGEHVPTDAGTSTTTGMSTPR